MIKERKVRTLRPGEEKKHLEILNLCYNPWGGKDKWNRRYQEHNFNISENVIVVEEDGRWLGGGTTWFRKAFLKNNKKVRVYIAGDAYVHPNHRGKGVYSTFIRARNELAQKKGAALGLSFITMYETPFMALQKYGFVDLFYPTTKILVLNPEKFLDYLIVRMKEMRIPEKFEGVTLKLILFFHTLGVKREASRLLTVKNGGFSEPDGSIGAKGVDLTVKTDAETLLEISRYFYLKKRTLYLRVLSAFVARRLKISFSLKFFKKLSGL